MSKPNKARYNLETLRKAHADKNGGDAIEFEFEGETFAIAAPGFWPDAAKVALKAGDDIGAATALMGGRYDDFTAKGGRADDVMIVVAAYADEQGIDLGE
ncbi:hypothetical protein [Streptomyces reniochalinae]|uniref:Uncharacterized protein n=1 Tax=Streptomyces reniochalinae TaxID=2250578 RepID=A0A367EH65_9ACTN|nr:hypothetical protein [Streptomyces reniochalinae]RCG16985.1 hypothetical protein DQ392_18065 [Streptomyces reniochalinae]